VTGTVTATNFSGNGSGVTNVAAATVNDTGVIGTGDAMMTLGQYNTPGVGSVISETPT